ncbi:LON peptidase substrate-binding domain-containing protein [Novosphingobium flavum]|uniref:LON peptidase substrate-binding domain-containing protein n=1 Tax=Novosphingobium flavum TaxID=1778672 RepID=A0A7X1KMY1_9SPHN|nr:LON peptidase substrate-binding domain-containing protein [Novosphingobium flavum]MBC2666780.1 LON peptidase substrate-binding domain-containing protein [Novosphingobium flavum]
MSGTRISIFPLSGAMLYPGLHLPLHIFEPRYRAMITDALARDRRIGMIQPQRADEGAPLFAVGCLGKIDEVEALPDGRFNIVLEGESRFRTLRELDVSTPFRQVEAELIVDPADEFLAPVERALFEREARRFADAQGYQVDWESLTRLDDQTVINAAAQIVPFDPASKQALLEADSLRERCDLLVQLLQFFSRRDGDEDHTTLQ